MDKRFKSERSENDGRNTRDDHAVREFWRNALGWLVLSWIAVAFLGLLDAYVPGLDVR